jgi:ribosomal protein S18 acetylase RimI-like enzyme
MEENSMPTIRIMTKDDVEDVRQVEATAFGAWWNGLHNDSIVMAKRTVANIRSRMARDPSGCFVAVEDGRIAGFIFSCTWGSTGWFGTFSVLPEYQGRKIGKELLTASLEYLRGAPRVIGLETMPDTPYNLGLYLGMGFQLRTMTLVLSRPVDPALPFPTACRLWSQADAGTRRRWLDDLRQAAEAISPGLDYSKEILYTEQFGLGETVILCAGDRAIGMNVVSMQDPRETAEQEWAVVGVTLLHPAFTDEANFSTLLQAGQSFAAAQGRSSYHQPLYAGHTWAMEQLLRHGFRVSRGLVRMVLQGTDEGPRDDRLVELSRWAG